MNNLTRKCIFRGMLCYRISSSTFLSKRDNVKVLIKSNILASGIIYSCSFHNNILSRTYSTEDKKHVFNFQKQTDLFQNVIDKNKEKFRDTENKFRQKREDFVKDFKHQKSITGQRIKEKKEIIIKDILETKSKVKEKIEEVIERENIYTIPNLLCVTRIVMSPYLGYIIIQENYNLALGLWVLAGITDLLDGWIARKWSSQSSKMGSFLDPMADKVLVATLFLTLTWQGLIPIPLTCLIVARDVVLVAAGFVIRYRSLEPPRTLARYFDVTRVTAQLAPTFISKVNTAIQLLLVGSTLGAPVFGYVDHSILQGLWGVTAASTIVAGLSYVYSKNTYKYIKQMKK